MRYRSILPLVLILAAGCSQSPSEATLETAVDASEEPAREFDFETAIGGIVRIEAEVCDGRSIGTGFLVDERHIVTVAHVVDGASSIIVEVQGDLDEAVTVGFDEERDIALLRSDIPLGSESFEVGDVDYETGDDIFAIGFPRGLDASLTTGVISNRKVEFDFIPFSRFIQVDAPLNPGNSGGPVFNEFGDVIGIVDWGLSESEGLNFAVAVNSVDRIVDSWIGNEPVEAGSCGDAPEELDPPAAIDLSQPGQYVIPTEEGETPPHPVSVAGYERDGPPVREDFRLFSNGVQSSWPHQAAMNHCSSAYWTARWRSLNDELLIESLIGPYYLAYEHGMAEDDFYAPIPDERRSPVPSTSGFISGFFCGTPAFQIVPGQYENGSNLVDMVVEVQYWRPAP